MINLDNVMNQTIDFMLKGELIKVQQPSTKLVKKFTQFEGSELKPNETFDKQVELITEIMNNNTSARKFTQSEIEALPQKVLSIIIKEITNSISAVENDPN